MDQLSQCMYEKPQSNFSTVQTLVGLVSNDVYALDMAANTYRSLIGYSQYVNKIINL